MTLALTKDFRRLLVKFNFWALHVCFITENNKNKYISYTYFSYFVQLMLFYCLNNSRIRHLLSGNIVPEQSNLLTRKYGLDRKMYAQEFVTQSYARPEILQTGRPRLHAAGRMKFLLAFCRKTERSTPSSAASFEVTSSYIDRRDQPRCASLPSPAQ